MEHDQRDAWLRASAGYVGSSDGWQDFSRHGSMQWQYTSAGPGNVALTGELPRRATLALGFASSMESAATLAVSALLRPFDEPWQEQIDDWTAWHNRCAELCKSQHGIPVALHKQFKWLENSDSSEYYFKPVNQFTTLENLNKATLNATRV